MPNRRIRMWWWALPVVAVAVIVAVVVSRPGGHSGGTAPPKPRAPLAVAARPAFATAIDGGGFQNVVAQSPFQPNLLLAGADVAGIARSTDGGKTWRRVNQGLSDPNAQHVASIVFSPTNPREVYAGVGRSGTGGFYVSTDAGLTWSQRSSLPGFSGSNNQRPVQAAPHPRSTGTLIAVDPRTKTVYAGTFDGGLMRSKDDGRTWTTLGLKGDYIRGIALDSNNPSVLYVATDGAGVFVTNDAAGTGTLRPSAGSPRDAEEIVVANGTAYLAAGADGVYAGEGGPANLRWRRLGSGVPHGPVWESVAARQVGSSVVVYAGSTDPGAGGASLVRSTDGGRSFATVLAGTGRVHNEIGGPGGPAWWLIKAQPRTMPGRQSYVAADIVVGPGGQSIWVAGRSGIWGSADSGANWYPMVRGLDVTITKGAVGDPNVPGRVYVAASDWTLFSSTDGLRTVTDTRPTGAGSDGYAVAVDPATTPSTVFVATGSRRGRASGEIYSSPDPLRGHWSSLGLSPATSGKRPIGVAVGYDKGSRVVLAAVQGGGIWRHTSSGWRLVEAQALHGVSDGPVSFGWATGSRTVYVWDSGRGLWRSADAGAHWSLVWAHESSGSTGEVALDPTNSDRGYISASDGIYVVNRLSNAPVATRVSGLSGSGPIAVDGHGSLFVALPSQGNGGQPRLLRSADQGARFESVGDAVFATTAVRPNELVATTDGHLLLTTQGTGALIGS